MGEIMGAIHDALSQIPEYTEGLSCLPASSPNLAWIDDLAAALCTTTAEAMEPLIQRVMQVIFDAFSTRGFQLNFGAGKSEIVLRILLTSEAS